jgi:hypothetical protein
LEECAVENAPFNTTQRAYQIFGIPDSLPLITQRPATNETEPMAPGFNTTFVPAPTIDFINASQTIVQQTTEVQPSVVVASPSITVQTALVVPTSAASSLIPPAPATTTTSSLTSTTTTVTQTPTVPPPPPPPPVQRNLPSFDYQKKNIRARSVDYLFVDPQSFDAPLSVENRTNVFCYYDMVTIAMTDKDQDKFNAMGLSVYDGKSANFIKFTEYDMLKPFIDARFARAKRLGCNGILWDIQDIRLIAALVDFSITDEIVVDYVKKLSEAAKSAGFKVGLQSPGYYTSVVKDMLDVILSISCDSAGTCAFTKEFSDSGKPVFDVEIGRTSAPICNGWNRYSISGVFKSAALDGNEGPQTCSA